MKTNLIYFIAVVILSFSFHGAVKAQEFDEHTPAERMPGGPADPERNNQYHLDQSPAATPSDDMVSFDEAYKFCKTEGSGGEVCGLAFSRVGWLRLKFKDSLLSKKVLSTCWHLAGEGGFPNSHLAVKDAYNNCMHLADMENVDLSVVKFCSITITKEQGSSTTDFDANRAKKCASTLMSKQIFKPFLQLCMAESASTDAAKACVKSLEGKSLSRELKKNLLSCIREEGLDLGCAKFAIAETDKIPTDLGECRQELSRLNAAISQNGALKKLKDHEAPTEDESGHAKAD